MIRVLLTILLAVLAAPADAQPFLYSVKVTSPCTTTGCASIRLVVTNARTGEIVNADDPALLGPADGIVNAMAVSNDGKRLFVSNSLPGVRSGRMIIINTVTNRIEDIIETGTIPWTLVASPDGTELYGGNPIAGSLLVFSTATGRLTRTIAMPNPYAVALSADGSLLAVTETSLGSAIWLVDPHTGTTRLRVGVPNYPQRIAMAPDGKRVYSVSFGPSVEGAIVTIDTDTGAILRSVSVAYHPSRIVANPTTGKLYLTFTEPGVYGVVSPDGTVTTHTAPIPSDATIVPSADWRVLYIAGNTEILAIDTSSDGVSGGLPGGSELHLAVSTSCDFTIPAPPAVFTAAGGDGTITVPAPTGCEWAVQNVTLPAGIQFTSSTAGVGPGIVSYHVRPSQAPFSANIRIAGQLTRVSQEVARLIIDTPANGATVSGSFPIRGWALAQASGATDTGIDVVHAWAFPVGGGTPRFLGSATMNGLRPDVGAVFGASYDRSGFAVNTPWLPAGRYHVALYGRSTATGNFDATSVVTITAAGQSALMSLDFPAAGSVVAATSPDLFIAGWAFDRAAASGTGVDVIHAWAWPVNGGAPVFVGSVAYGTARPDVAAFYGQGLSASGFGAVLPKPPPGTYDLAVYARSTVTGVFDQWRVVRITIQP